MQKRIINQSPLLDGSSASLPGFGDSVKQEQVVFSGLDLTPLIPTLNGLKMERHYELNDDQFEQQFKNRQLDPAIFSHEAHLRLAWIHIKKHGMEKAIENICAQLAGYVEKLGVADKYNHTVTIAAIRAVHHFAGKSVSDNFSDFILEFPRLKTNFKEIIRTHYSQDIFNTISARRQYLEPDLLPFS